MMPSQVLLQSAPLPPGSTGRLQRVPPVAVQLEGYDDPRWVLRTVRHGAGAQGGQAVFEWTGRSGDFGLARDLAARGGRIRARLVRPLLPGQLDDLPIFDGYVVQVRVEFSGSDRRILLDAADGLSFLHGGTAVVGQWGLLGGQRLGLAADAALVLNAGGRPNRSRTAHSINGRSTFVFEPRAEQADFWTAADAINYLLAVFLAGDSRLVLPAPSRIESLCRQGRPRDLELTGRPLLAALEQLGRLTAAGFAVEPSQSFAAGAGWRMRWFSRTGGRVVVLRHQRAGQWVDPAATNLTAGSLAIEHDDVRHVWVGLGDREQVESTWPLVGGWDPALETGEQADHRTFSRANESFHLVRDVFRRWVLNEAGDWTGPPYDRGPAADLGGVFGAADYLLTRRRFLPCLSRDGRGHSFGVFVEVSYDGGTNWRRYAGRIEVLGDEAGIWIADEQLPPDYWQAARAGQLAVRVTACLQGDRRAAVRADDPVRSAGRRTVQHLRWLGNRFRRQWVDAGSRFAGQTSGGADEIDDRQNLAAALAEQIRLDRRSAVRGWLDLPWMDLTCQVGDRVRGIGGQALSFESGCADQPREPLVGLVRHDLADGWQTRLELE